MTPQFGQIWNLPRRPDGDGFHIHFTGGFRAAKLFKNGWRIEPILVNKQASATGVLSMEQLRALTDQNGLCAIAFHKFGWTGGEYSSFWNPIIPGRTSHLQGAADLWSNIAANIGRSRVQDYVTNNTQPDSAEILKTLANREPAEALAKYISLSLRSMDISVQQISEHYYEQLINHMSAGRVDGEQSANTLSQILYAHVHSFFLHLGAARDYLGALIALRVGFDHSKTDSIARLTDKLRPSCMLDDALLKILIAGKNISANPEKPGTFVVDGWIQAVTSIRNELVHRRPYGSKFTEKFGLVVPLQKDIGIYKYFRPLDLDGNAKDDVLDVVHYHYGQCIDLFYQAAKASGDNTAMTNLTDDDVISFEIPEPDKTKS